MLCWYCNLDKDITLFFKSNHRIDGTGLCKECKKLKRNKQAHREWEAEWRKQNPEKARSKDRRARLMYRYGLSENDLAMMALSQDGKCKICNQATKLVIDHNHSTGKVRALLCDRCNRVLGVVENNLTLVEKMKIYLAKFE